jgi:hypothetical protein
MEPCTNALLDASAMFPAAPITTEALWVKAFAP